MQLMPNLSSTQLGRKSIEFTSSAKALINGKDNYEAKIVSQVDKRSQEGSTGR